MMKKLNLPITEQTIAELRAGDEVLIDGELYVARDAAHKKMLSDLDKGISLPFEVKGQIIYYMGPSPARPGQVIGSSGPTTSSRMDSYALRLIDMGLKGMIGKGKRSPAVKEAMKKHKAVYMATVGGTGALISKVIKESKVIAYEELGPEAVLRLKVKDFPVTVINDIYGGDLYEEGKAKYRQAID